MFDHDDRVAEVAQIHQRVEEPLVVPLVQTDRRFIEDVHDADQARADLTRQADALGLAAGQGVRAAVQGQVAEADVVQESQPVADFLDDLGGDLPAPAGEFELAAELQGARDRQGRDLRNAAAVHEDVPRRQVEPGTLAHRAGTRGEILRQFFAHGRRFGFPVAALQIPDDSFEGVAALDRAAFAVEVFEFDLHFIAAKQHQILDLLRQAVERRLDVELRVAREGLDQLKIIGVAPIPTAHRPAGQRQMRIRDDLPGIEKILGAEPVAGRAGADRAVEGEQSRLELAQRVVADGTGEFVRKHEFAALRIVHEGNTRHTRAQAQCRFERFGEALAQVGPHLEAIDDCLHGVLAAHIEFGRAIQFHHFTVDAGAYETGGLQFFDELGMFSLALGDGRREQHHGGSFRMLEHRINHLAHGLRGQIDVMVRAAGRARPGVQQAQVIVDFRDRADGGARIVRGGLLLDRDCRRQPLDGVDVRLLHHRQELPRVSRQRFHIAPLTLGVDGVEGEGGLAGAGKAGEHDQPIPRQVEIDVFEVMGPGTPDADILHVTNYYTRGVKRG